MKMTSQARFHKRNDCTVVTRTFTCENCGAVEDHTVTVFHRRGTLCQQSDGKVDFNSIHDRQIAEGFHWGFTKTGFVCPACDQNRKGELPEFIEATISCDHCKLQVTVCTRGCHCHEPEDASIIAIEKLVKQGWQHLGYFAFCPRCWREETEGDWCGTLRAAF